jgi:hypothetical protein
MPRKYPGRNHRKYHRRTRPQASSQDMQNPPPGWIDEISSGIGSTLRRPDVES